MAAKGARIPGDATVADLARAQQVRRDAPRIKNLSPGELQARVRQSINTPVPMDNSAQLSVEMEGQMQLKVTDIDPYDKNPRQAANEKYEVIKESIRTSKMLSPLVVTRRPGATRFMIGAGGNSRLKAQTELWLETHEPRYEHLLVTYRPWESEVKTLAAHVIENELRGEMIFWDKAHGVWKMKEELEAERGGNLSLRQLHDALRSHGLTVSIAMLSFYSFALDNLTELGMATQYLSGTTVAALQPNFKLLSTYFISAHGRSTNEWNNLRVGVLQAEAQALLRENQKPDDGEETDSGKQRRLLDADRLIAALEEAIAQALDQTAAQVRDVRLLAKTLPKASMTELLQHYQGICAKRRVPSSESAPISAHDNATSASRAEKLPSVPDIVAAKIASPGAEGPAEDEAERHTALTQTSGHHATPSPSAAKAAPSPLHPLKAVQECVTSFARLCGFADCLHITDAMPAGYYVEVPENGSPLDLDPDYDEESGHSPRNRYTGWWLAATHSGQISGEFSERMDISSRWRQAQLRENNMDEIELQSLIENVLGNPIHVTELGDWLTLPHNRAIADYLPLLKALQHLRITHPARFVVGGAA